MCGLALVVSLKRNTQFHVINIMCTIILDIISNYLGLLQCLKVSDTSAIICRLSACVTDIATWCASLRLQLNGAKTEISWFGSRANLNKISGSDLCLPVGSNVIKPREVVRDLGVYLDSELSFKQHITKVANSCFL